jgi:hypothetical protein
VSWFMRSRIGGSRSAEEFRGGSGGGIVGSGSPGTGSRFSGSGFEVFGQSSGGFGSHLEDSASLWYWSCGIALSFHTENPRCLRSLEKPPPAADLFGIRPCHFGDGIIHRGARVLPHLDLWLSTLEDVEAGRCSLLFTLRRFLGQSAQLLLASSIKGRVKKKHNPIGWNFSCFSAHLIERDLF